MMMQRYEKIRHKGKLTNFTDWLSKKVASLYISEGRGVLRDSRFLKDVHKKSYMKS